MRLYWVCEKKTSPVHSSNEWKNKPLLCSSVRISKRDTHIHPFKHMRFKLTKGTHTHTQKKCAGNFFLYLDIIFLYFRLVVSCIVLSIALETPSMSLNSCWKKKQKTQQLLVSQQQQQQQHFASYSMVIWIQKLKKKI